MSELKTYRECKEAWALAMVWKYLWRHHRFKKSVSALFHAATEEEKELAKKAYEDYK